MSADCRWRIWAAAFLGLIGGAVTWAPIGWWAMPGYLVFLACAVIAWRAAAAGGGGTSG